MERFVNEERNCRQTEGGDQMSVEINLKDIIQVVTFVVLLVSVFWKFSMILSNIQTELRLITQAMSNLSPQLVDHETRIRKLEGEVANLGSACKVQHGP